MAETFHLLEEALRSDCEVKAVLAAASVEAAAEAHVRRLSGVKVVVLPDELFAAVSGTEAAQGVMALVVPPEWKLPHLFRGCPLVVILDGLQDPGNAGAIMRAAEAFGATGAVFVKGTVSPFNPKTIRASAGSLFRVPFLYGVDAALARAAIEQNRVKAFAAVPAHPGGEARSLAEVDLSGPVGFIIGNEARGVGAELRAAARDDHHSHCRRGIVERIGSGRNPALRSAPATGIAIMSLFDMAPLEAGNAKRPLADRMRPESFEDYVGQEQILGPGKPLRREIERDELSSIILWGPPGCGQDLAGAADCAAHARANSCPSARCWPESRKSKRSWPMRNACAAPAAAPFCLSTKFTALTKPSRMPFCPTSNAATSS